LREAERFNRSIIESSIDMIMAFDMQGKIIQFNHAASVEFGLTIEDARELDAAQFLADPLEFKDHYKHPKRGGILCGRGDRDSFVRGGISNVDFHCCFARS